MGIGPIKYNIHYTLFLVLIHSYYSPNTRLYHEYIRDILIGTHRENNPS